MASSESRTGVSVTAKTPFEDNIDELLKLKVKSVADLVKDAKEQIRSWQLKNKDKLSNVSVSDAIEEITKSFLLTYDQLYKTTDLLLAPKRSQEVVNLQSQEAQAGKLGSLESMNVDEPEASQDPESATDEQMSGAQQFDTSRRESSRKSSESGQKSIIDNITDIDIIRCSCARVFNEMMDEELVIKFEIPSLIDVNIDTLDCRELVNQAEKNLAFKIIWEKYHDVFTPEEFVQATDWKKFLKKIEKKEEERMKKENKKVLEEEKKLPGSLLNLCKTLQKEIYLQHKAAAQAKVKAVRDGVLQMHIDAQEHLEEFPDLTCSLHDIKCLLEAYQIPIMEMYGSDKSFVEQKIKTFYPDDEHFKVEISEGETETDAYYDFQARQAVVLRSVTKVSLSLKRRMEYYHDYTRLLYEIMTGEEDAAVERIKTEFMNIVTDPKKPNYLILQECSSIKATREVRFVENPVPRQDRLGSLADVKDIPED